MRPARKTVAAAAPGPNFRTEVCLLVEQNTYVTLPVHVLTISIQGLKPAAMFE